MINRGQPDFTLFDQQAAGRSPEMVAPNALTRSIKSVKIDSIYDSDAEHMKFLITIKLLSGAKIKKVIFDDFDSVESRKDPISETFNSTDTSGNYVARIDCYDQFCGKAKILLYEKSTNLNATIEFVRSIEYLQRNTLNGLRLSEKEKSLLEEAMEYRFPIVRHSARTPGGPEMDVLVIRRPDIEESAEDFTMSGEGGAQGGEGDSAQAGEGDGSEGSQVPPAQGMGQMTDDDQLELESDGTIVREQRSEPNGAKPPPTAPTPSAPESSGSRGGTPAPVGPPPAPAPKPASPAPSSAAPVTPPAPPPASSAPATPPASSAPSSAPPEAPTPPSAPAQGSPTAQPEVESAAQSGEGQAADMDVPSENIQLARAELTITPNPFDVYNITWPKTLFARGRDYVRDPLNMNTNLRILPIEEQKTFEPAFRMAVIAEQFVAQKVKVFRNSCSHFVRSVMTLAGYTDGGYFVANDFEALFKTKSQGLSEWRQDRFLYNARDTSAFIQMTNYLKGLPEYHAVVMQVDRRRIPNPAGKRSSSGGHVAFLVRIDGQMLVIDTTLDRRGPAKTPVQVKSLITRNRWDVLNFSMPNLIDEQETAGSPL